MSDDRPTISLTCPGCGYHGPFIEFDLTPACEIACPRCEWAGVLPLDVEDEDDKL